MAVFGLTSQAAQQTENASTALSLLNSMSRAGAQLAMIPLKGVTPAVESGVAAERRARTALLTAGERAALDAFDRVIDTLLSGDAVDRLIDRIETAHLAERVAARALEDGIVEQITQQALAGPQLERVVGSVLDSTLPEVVVAHLLRSEALWVLVDEIARSPSVSEAIARQGTGFAEQVASVARERSRYADEWVERVARRIGRHPSQGTPREGLGISRQAPLPGGEAR